ncbi:hypothetical protein A2U01_0077637, partial [Trifolium medium]|nr:hypothetical protein [Trifolium medium]
ASVLFPTLSQPIANQTHRSAVTVDSHCSAATVLVPGFLNIF